MYLRVLLAGAGGRGGGLGGRLFGGVVGDTMCEKRLAQIRQRLYHSFPNPQYKVLGLAHTSTCLLNIH